MILHPEDGQHFETREVVFEGKTEAGARVFAGKYEADVDELGNWRIVLLLTNDGWNRATLSARDGSGNESTASVEAYYEAPEKEAPPEDDKPEEESAGHDFTASQKFGTCAEEPPYDIWYGTGEPGTKIWIGSEYGEGSTTVGEKGKWDLKVKFFEAPCNETIQVVLETERAIARSTSSSASVRRVGESTTSRPPLPTGETGDSYLAGCPRLAFAAPSVCTPRGGNPCRAHASESVCTTRAPNPVCAHARVSPRA